MLRTLLLVCALIAPSTALAEQFPDSAIDAPVLADNGVEVGRVSAVERNARGEIVAAEIPGLEPGDAPRVPTNLVAEEAPAHERPAAARPAEGEGRLTRASLR